MSKNNANEKSNCQIEEIIEVMQAREDFDMSDNCVLCNKEVEANEDFEDEGVEVNGKTAYLQGHDCVVTLCNDCLAKKGLVYCDYCLYAGLADYGCFITKEKEKELQPVSGLTYDGEELFDLFLCKEVIANLQADISDI